MYVAGAFFCYSVAQHAYLFSPARPPGENLGAVGVCGSNRLHLTQSPREQQQRKEERSFGRLGWGWSGGMFGMLSCYAHVQLLPCCARVFRLCVFRIYASPCMFATQLKEHSLR